MRLPLPSVIAGVAVVALGAAGLIRAAVPQGSSGGPATPLTVTGAFVRAPVPPTTLAAAYFTVHNSGSTPDRLLAVVTPVARESMLHQDVGGRMVPLPKGAVIPAHGTLVLTAGQDHVMLEQLVATMSAGQQVTLTLTFQHAGTIDVTAPVIGPAAPVPTSSASPGPSH